MTLLRRAPRLALLSLLGAFALAVVACSAKPEAASPPAEPVEARTVPAADETGRKPDYVKCDPAHPELPCTPEPEPRRATPPGVKPHYVKCDPAHPEMPCTPEPVAPADIEAATPPGVKPHYVKCDPARPELPCTPDVQPGGASAPAATPR